MTEGKNPDCKRGINLPSEESPLELQHSVGRLTQPRTLRARPRRRKVQNKPECVFYAFLGS